MSSSIAIPQRKQPIRSSVSSSSSSSYTSFSGSMHSPRTPTFSSSSKGKQKAQDPPTPERTFARRPSLLGSSLSESSYTVINLGHSDGPPRLVTCVKSSQGFDWNQELFLPSYADYDSQDLEHRPDPVKEIVLTDEEAAAIMPQ